MTLPTNDDIAKRELSIEELEAIAAGGLLGWTEGEAKSVWHGIEHGVDAALNWLSPNVKITFTLGHPANGTPHKVS
jgi:hypothetical protein